MALKKIKEVTINEELSNSLKNLLRTAAENMASELGISIEEALYVTSLYGELKDKNLFKTSYMQGIKLVADNNEKLPDITNLQQMVKYPELMYDIIKYVLLESDEFTNNYDISYSDEKLAKISKKDANKKEKEIPISTFETPWDEFKVAEDDNYITFQLPKYDGNLQNYYNKVFSEDTRITKNPNSRFLVTSWCVLSSSDHYFDSQRDNDPENLWFFTFLKKNPIDFVINQIKKTGSMSEQTKEILIHALNNRGGISESYQRVLRRDYFGECFLMHKKGAAFSYPRGNFGYHNYDNSPGEAVGDSTLKVPTLYNYFSLKSALEPFTISNGTLTAYNYNEEEVTIPEGVVRIGENAFRNKQVTVVNLPRSLTTIMSKAFLSCSNLQEIRATNSLSYIQINAFDQTSANQLVLGVFSTQPDGSIVISKPVSLQHFPEGIFNKPDSLMRYGIIATDPETGEVLESKKVRTTEAVRLANKPLYDYNNKAYIIEHNNIYFNPQASSTRFGDLIIPEGVRQLKSQIYGMYDSIVFPSTFTGWPETTEPLFASPVTANGAQILDFSKVTSIRVVQDQKFYFANVKHIILPASVLIIGKKAFFLTTAKTIFIPSNVGEISHDAFRNTNISTIFTDNVEVLTQKLENVPFRYKPEIVSKS